MNSLRIGLKERYLTGQQLKRGIGFISGVTWDLLDSNNVRERVRTHNTVENIPGFTG